MVEAQGLREVVMNLVQRAIAAPQQAEWTEPVSVETVFLDSTAVELDIHYPVDWVLLRDGVRTLVKAMILIRKEGIKVRMDEPSTFLSEINKLCMKMTAAGKRSGNKKERKKVLRQMRAHVRVVMAHAERHRDKLAAEWEQTGWSEKETNVVLARIETMRAALPVAMRQAHERIIGERLVKNEEKVLSLYEPHASVIVRGKAGAQVEFGRQLLLAEAGCGLVIDWDLRAEKVESDVYLMTESLERMGKWSLPVSVVVGDRGFDSKAMGEELERKGLENGIAPKDLKRFAESWKEEKFSAVAPSEGADGGSDRDFQERVFGWTAVEQGDCGSGSAGGMGGADAQSLAVGGPEEVEWAAAAGQLRGERAGKGEGKRGARRGVPGSVGRRRCWRREGPERTRITRLRKVLSRERGPVSKMG